jgi:raffinose/stachyose/melibiose transport system substrate-binding protein
MKEVKKIAILALVVVMVISMVAMFSLTGCKTTTAETTAVETTAAVTTAAETTAVETTAAAAPVTITFWHIQVVEEQIALWQKLADEYKTAHPNVTIEITSQENEAFKTKMTTVMQAGDPPDIFQSWGGGGMNDYAKAGLLLDITSYLDKDGWRDTFSPGALGVYSYQGKNYGVPRDMGMVGFWYNKELFTKAGIANPPTTWTELLADIEKLKDAKITPIALGEGDKWPGAFWWEYLATRIGGQAGFDAAYSRTGSFADAPFVEAGTKLKELVAVKPFQSGFLAATWGLDEPTIMGNGEAAMDLMGQWAPAAFTDFSADKKGLGDKLGWFAFPIVEGGAGDPADALGGGNGFTVGKNAPPEAVDFLKYISSVDSQIAQAKINMSVPVVVGAEVGLADPLLLAVQKGFASAKYFQLYYDQAMPPAVGSVINDSVQGIFAGTMTPEKAAQAIEASAAENLK